MATINVLEANDNNVFDLLAFSEQSVESANYFQQQVSTVLDGLQGAGKAFLEGAREVYDRTYNSNALRTARAAIRTAKGVLHPNTIVQYNNVEEIRSAQPLMQRYIMANPELRTVYQKQRCDGYSDTYVDMQPDAIAETHDDYRRVMDGMVVEDESGDWSVTTYVQDDFDNKELCMDEKVDILNTWDLVNMFVEQGDDPTDIYL